MSQILARAGHGKFGKARRKLPVPGPEGKAQTVEGGPGGQDLEGKSGLGLGRNGGTDHHPVPGVLDFIAEDRSGGDLPRDGHLSPNGAAPAEDFVRIGEAHGQFVGIGRGKIHRAEIVSPAPLIGDEVIRHMLPSGELRQGEADLVESGLEDRLLNELRLGFPVQVAHLDLEQNGLRPRGTQTHALLQILFRRDGGFHARRVPEGLEGRNVDVLPIGKVAAVVGRTHLPGVGVGHAGEVGGLQIVFALVPLETDDPGSPVLPDGAAPVAADLPHVAECGSAAEEPLGNGKPFSQQGRGDLEAVVEENTAALLLELFQDLHELRLDHGLEVHVLHDDDPGSLLYGLELGDGIGFEGTAELHVPRHGAALDLAQQGDEAVFQFHALGEFDDLPLARILDGTGGRQRQIEDLRHGIDGIGEPLDVGRHHRVGDAFEEIQILVTGGLDLFAEQFHGGTLDVGEVFRNQTDVVQPQSLGGLGNAEVEYAVVGPLGHVEDMRDLLPRIGVLLVEHVDPGLLDIFLVRIVEVDEAGGPDAVGVLAAHLGGKGVFDPGLAPELDAQGAVLRRPLVADDLQALGLVGAVVHPVIEFSAPDVPHPVEAPGPGVLFHFLLEGTVEDQLGTAGEERLVVDLAAPAVEAEAVIEIFGTGKAGLFRPEIVGETAFEAGEIIAFLIDTGHKDQHPLFAGRKFFHREGHGPVVFGRAVGQLIHGDHGRIHVAGDPDAADRVAVLAAAFDIHGLEGTGHRLMSAEGQTDRLVVFGVVLEDDGSCAGALLQGAVRIFFQRLGHIFRQQELHVETDAFPGGNGLFSEKALQSGLVPVLGEPAVISASEFLREKQHGARLVVVAHDRGRGGSRVGDPDLAGSVPRVDVLRFFALAEVGVGVAHAEAVVAAEHGPDPEPGLLVAAGNVLQRVSQGQCLRPGVDGVLLGDAQEIEIPDAQGAQGDGVGRQGLGGELQSGKILHDLGLFRVAEQFFRQGPGVLHRGSDLLVFDGEAPHLRASGPDDGLEGPGTDGELRAAEKGGGHSQQKKILFDVHGILLFL